jgi:hypothetical protein
MRGKLPGSRVRKFGAYGPFGQSRGVRNTSASAGIDPRLVVRRGFIDRNLRSPESGIGDLCLRPIQAREFDIRGWNATRYVAGLALLETSTI